MNYLTRVASARSWWLMAFCGALDATISILFFEHAVRGFHAAKELAFLGEVAIAAGVCSIAAGVRPSARNESRLLVVNGLALAALGLILNGIAGPRISLRNIALLMLLMAASLAAFELLRARDLWSRRQLTEGRLLGLAGLVSVGFAVVFFALALGWMKLVRGPPMELVWLGAYFGFTAVCMVALALRQRVSASVL